MKPLFRLTLPILAVIITAACVALPGNPEKMTAEQLAAWAKDKNANIACGTATNMAGRANLSYVVLDRSVIPSGSVTVDPDCKITITNDTPKK